MGSVVSGQGRIPKAGQECPKKHPILHRPGIGHRDNNAVNAAIIQKKHSAVFKRNAASAKLGLMAVDLSKWRKESAGKINRSRKHIARSRDVSERLLFAFEKRDALIGLIRNIKLP